MVSVSYVPTLHTLSHLVAHYISIRDNRVQAQTLRLREGEGLSLGHTAGVK